VLDLAGGAAAVVDPELFGPAGAVVDRGGGAVGAGGGERGVDAGQVGQYGGVGGPQGLAGGVAEDEVAVVLHDEVGAGVAGGVGGPPDAAVVAAGDEVAVGLHGKAGDRAPAGVGCPEHAAGVGAVDDHVPVGLHHELGFAVGRGELLADRDPLAGVALVGRRGHGVEQHPGVGGPQSLSGGVAEDEVA